mgnify:FL=1|tara:strand:+ start:357 stop:1268 length:912 start_codon:yes stop_codon:yes gene_type:complete
MGLINTTQQAYYSGNDFGSYQFVSLEDIINNFIVAYVGEGKIINKVRRSDIQFHSRRALQELSFDVFKSTKSQEIELSASCTMVLPQDYVNYVKLMWTDNNGIERILYPTSKTSNPFAIDQSTTGFSDNDSGYNLDPNTGYTDLLEQEESDTWTKYKASGDLTGDITNASSDDQDSDLYDYNKGQRYGIDPQFAQVNGSFYIDELKGKIHFSSNVSGKTVILKYISDSLGTDAEMQVHKFAEEAMYKYIAHAILSTKINIPEYLVARFKKERFAEVRKAKLRLSNIKLEEITQILRGKFKQIK